ncbi:MAG: class I SAM-dependent methyltransferase, partial [Chloroflexota bacterium]
QFGNLVVSMDRRIEAVQLSRHRKSRKRRPSMTAFYTTVARYYDAENADKTDDIDFYTELAEEIDGPILDVGCGSGRVVLPLALNGYTVLGIDDNTAMLARARQRIARQPQFYETLTLHEGDILTHQINETFSLILLTYNMLMHFHDVDAQINLLQRMRQLIADSPNSRLVLDLPNAGEMFATPDSDAITLERTFIDPETGHMVMQQAVSVLDRATQLMRVTWIYDEIDGGSNVKRTVAPTVFRYFMPYEVQHLLTLTGFRVTEIYGDTDGSPFEDGCPRMMVLASPE